MVISFDLNIMTKGTDFLRIPILSFVGKQSRLVFYLNGWGEFGIMHHDEELDGFDHYEQMMDCNLYFLPNAGDQAFRRFRIVIPNNKKVGLRTARFISVNIDGHMIDRVIDREICPWNQSMNICWGKADFGGNETISNVMINAI